MGGWSLRFFSGGMLGACSKSFRNHLCCVLVVEASFSVGTSFLVWSVGCTVSGLGPRGGCMSSSVF